MARERSEINWEAVKFKKFICQFQQDIFYIHTAISKERKKNMKTKDVYNI